jgi:hypothetical protein
VERRGHCRRQEWLHGPPQALQSHRVAASRRAITTPLIIAARPLARMCFR